MKPHNSMAIFSMCFCIRRVRGYSHRGGTWIRFVAFCFHAMFDLKWQKQMMSYIYKLKFQMQYTIWLPISSGHYLTQSFRFRIIPLDICNALIVALSPLSGEVWNYLGLQCTTHNEGIYNELCYPVQTHNWFLSTNLANSFISFPLNTFLESRVRIFNN